LGEIVYWCLYQIPQPAIARACLSPAERTTYDRFRFDARRKSWLAGRYTAKLLLLRVLNGRRTPLEKIRQDQIEIHNDELGAPSAYHRDQIIPGCLSISHSGDWCAAAFAPAKLQVGIDIEVITQRPAGFIQDYFTKNEIAMVSPNNGRMLAENRQAEMATLIWSAKEALLKAMGIGLRLDTRHVEVDSIEAVEQADALGWRRLGLSSIHLSSRIDAYWRKVNGYLLTLAVLADKDERISLVEVN
jgi:4'-phosphopantetheinyl transferase